MKITLTPQESEEFFYNSLCNALGTGYLSGYGIDIDAKEDTYAKAKKTLKDKGESPCYEDVLMQVLRQGDELWVFDIENDGEMNTSITLADVHERVQQTPLTHLVAMINETDDAETADAIIQTTFFKEIIFG
jgi:hypothetical protein